MMLVMVGLLTTEVGESPDSSLGLLLHYSSREGEELGGGEVQASCVFSTDIARKGGSLPAVWDESSLPYLVFSNATLMGTLGYLLLVS